MHPSQSQLIEYILSDETGKSRLSEITEHLSACSLCRTRMDEATEWMQAIGKSQTEGLPESARQQTEQLFRQSASKHQIIPLKLLPVKPRSSPIRLAADGQPVEAEPAEGLEHLATLYSESPELVLRVMRDRRSGEQSLHLIGDDPTMTQSVIISIAEPKSEFLTDSAGIAQLIGQRLDSPEKLSWQVRLPDAEFALKPLGDSLDKSELRSFDLEADDRNRIHVELQSIAGGVTLHMQLVRIGGRDDLTGARIVVSQGPMAQSTQARKGQPCTVTGLKPDHPIDIRIFAD